MANYVYMMSNYVYLGKNCVPFAGLTTSVCILSRMHELGKGCRYNVLVRDV